jgi:hypothetical protein
VSLLVKQNGTWTEIDTCKVKQNGVWQQCAEVLVKKNGVWQSVWVNATTIPAAMVVYFDGTLGAGFTKCDGGSSTPNLIGAFAYGAATEAARTGSDSHTPANKSAYATAAGGAAVYNGRGGTWKNATNYQHTHNVPLHTHSAQEHIPPYYELVPGTGATKLVSGGIIFYEGSSAPSGWSIATGLNAKFIRGQNTAGNTGGLDTHTHGSASLTSTTDGQVAVGVSVRYYFMMVHNHSANHGCSQSTHTPTYIELLPIKADSAGAPLASGMVAFFAGSSVPTGWSLCDGSGSTTNMQSKFIRCNSGGWGSTGGAAVHTDACAGFNTGYKDQFGYNYVGTTTAPIYWRLMRANHLHSAAAHNHGTTNTNLPTRVPLIIARKD